MRRRALLIALGICSFMVCGCVRRRITVRTNAPGAQVYVDRKPIGQSPASTSTIYYGTRLIEVVADGYETEKVLHRFNPPWYQIPPIDFFAETLWPWELRDEQTVDVAMRPKRLPDRDELVARGQVLRTQSSQGVATPLVAPPPGNDGVAAVTENPSAQITTPGNPGPAGVVPNPSVLPGPSFPNQVLPNPYVPSGSPAAGFNSGVASGSNLSPNPQSGAGGWMSPSVPPVRDYRPAINGN
jgi:hypothetical protein